jgi:hypothetical protein
MDLHIAWVELLGLWRVENGGEGIRGRCPGPRMAVDVRRLWGLRAMISSRHGLPARDICHHGYESGNVNADKVTSARFVIG